MKEEGRSVGVGGGDVRGEAEVRGSNRQCFKADLEDAGRGYKPEQEI